MERSVVRPARRTRLIAAGAVVAALLTAGCGETVGHTDATGDRANGKELFVAKCGSCHTLADAGTKGQIGPNLDYAFLQSRRDGLGESTIMQVVRGQIAYPVTETSTGAPGMPKDIVTGQAAVDISTYVAAVAGTGVPGTGASETTPTETTPDGDDACGDDATGGGRGGCDGGEGGVRVGGCVGVAIRWRMRVRAGVWARTWMMRSRMRRWCRSG